MMDEPFHHLKLTEIVTPWSAVAVRVSEVVMIKLFSASMRTSDLLVQVIEFDSSVVWFENDALETRKEKK